MTGPEEDRALENGNPDIWIPVDLPVEEWEAPHLERKKKVVGARNPDIRVPERVKREEGLCAVHTAKEKDTEEKDADRVTESSAPFRAEPGSEWHPTGPEEDRALENGNPDIRTPVDLPVEEREAPRLERKKKVVGAGNPDIRVPERVKREEGLCAAHTAEEKDGEEKDAEEKDAEEERTEIASREDSEGYEKISDPHLGRNEPGNTRETPTGGQDSSERLELHHVPGGTWLKQVSGWQRPFVLVEGGIVRQHRPARMSPVSVPVLSRDECY
ncbi:hypothetical protein NDU88_000889 [Pleurodeles waltl]|uniref:Uncharacterized protein n=1 Tax=Pleurodeles waltl TaxID=8319 RepID=A0AAV7U6V5_PLEWA|nr:hypothetical protein NDU88_000889 [Pleurodeles waltl]